MSSKRITKDLSKNLARILVGGYEQEAKRLENVLEEDVYLHLHSIIPKDVLTISTKFDSFFSFGKTHKLYTDSTFHGSFRTSKRLPEKKTSTYSLSTFNVSLSVGETFSKAEDDIKTLRRKTSELRDKFAGVIYSLRTYKSIIENFPELEEHLPKDSSNVALVNIDVIRSEIKLKTA